MGDLQPAHQHQSRRIHIHSILPSLNRCWPLITHSLPYTFSGIHSTAQHHFDRISSSCLGAAQTGVQRTSPQTCIQRRPGHIRIATAANLSWENSLEHAIARYLCPPATDVLTPTRSAAHLSAVVNTHTVFTVRRYTTTPWALLQIFPGSFPAGSGRRTLGAAKRNAIWALSKATSLKRSMPATVSGGWEDYGAIREQ